MPSEPERERINPEALQYPCLKSEYIEEDVKTEITGLKGKH